MIVRVEVWTSLLALLVIVLGKPVAGSGAAPCAGVVLTPLVSDSHAATPAALRETQEILVERVDVAHEFEGMADSLFVSLDRERFVLDAPGMTCAEATSLAKSRIARATTVEIGLAGKETRFRDSDLESHIEVVDGEVRLRLRPQASEGFRALTGENIGKTVVVRINDSAPIELPVRAEQTTGVIVLDRSMVPKDAFIAETLLPLRLEVSGCGNCLGEYR